VTDSEDRCLIVGDGWEIYAWDAGVEHQSTSYSKLLLNRRGDFERRKFGRCIGTVLRLDQARQRLSPMALALHFPHTGS